MVKFLSARPVRAATREARTPELRHGCFYPRDPCGPRPWCRWRLRRKERFLSARPVRAATLEDVTATITGCEFLSARPVRAATLLNLPGTPGPFGFYPRDPCGPRLQPAIAQPRTLFVSIRATRAGRDLASAADSSRRIRFLSARPVRAATYFVGLEASLSEVSIRATRAGRDPRWYRRRCRRWAFLSARPVRAATRPPSGC